MDSFLHKIITYYDSCEFDYSLFMNLKKNHSMHLGYWDESVKNFSQAMQRINTILTEMAGIQKDDVVLDSGCGVGGSSIFLSKTIGCTVHGITVSKRQAGHASGYAKKYATSRAPFFSVADYARTPFRQGSFDVVWAIESACHAYDVKQFLSESSRLLKYKGKLIIADGFASQNKLVSNQTGIMRKWLAGWCVKSLETAETYQRLLSELNFKNISFTNITKNILPTSRELYIYSLPSLLLGTIARCIGLMSKLQLANIRSAYYQYRAIKDNLWKYGILYAEKS